MHLSQIETNLQKFVTFFSRESFLCDLLTAYGLPKSTVTLIKSGQRNMSKKEGEIIAKKLVYFREVTDGSDLFNTIHTLSKDQSNHRHKPRFFIVTDFNHILAIDAKTHETLDCKVTDLPKHATFFLAWAGVEKSKSKDENPADIRASYTMAKLYDEILRDNHIDTAEERHALNVFLARILFCFFAEDTGIFAKDIFSHSLDAHTQLNGSDMHSYLKKLFDILDTPKENRKDLPNYLEAFDYVNGDFFKKSYPIPHFNAKSRRILIECGKDLDWKDINPDIFGSMVQAVVHPDQRSGLGMHYTSVTNIMKVIEPLFLDDLKLAYASAKDSPKKLQTLLHRLTKIRIFDPACGSGNFIIIAYKELRKIEIDILQDLADAGAGILPISEISLSQFYGIEIDDFAHEIAGLSLYLAEHQMNCEFAGEFHIQAKTLPLKKGGNIVCANATRIDWETVCPKSLEHETYVLGNPPYLGSRNQNDVQKEDMQYVLKKDYKSLDYIACWFVKGAEYIRSSSSKMAFVSTNSICQGEQVALLWPRVLGENLEICFAVTSFKWENHAKKNAGVTVIIVGVANKNKNEKYIYGENGQQKAVNISPYLTPSRSIFVQSRSRPISAIPEMKFGNMPADDGLLLFTQIEKDTFIKKEPNSEIFFKKLIAAHEYINGKNRYCLWLIDLNFEELEQRPLIKDRIDKLRIVRYKSARPQLASIPHLFAQITQPENADFILIPRHSSEHRDYIPMGFFTKNFVSHDSCLIVPNAEPYLFGLLTSRMHMVWVRAVAGRLKTDYRYSSALCYNTFPIPPLTDEQKQMIDHNVRNILSERERYSERTMAELYDPDKMPAGLREAHRMMDELIDRIYRAVPFQSDEERLAYLFTLYERMVDAEKKVGNGK